MTVPPNAVEEVPTKELLEDYTFDKRTLSTRELERLRDALDRTVRKLRDQERHELALKADILRKAIEMELAA